MLSDEEKQAIEGLKGSQKWIRQQIRLGNLPNYNQGHYADIQIVLNLIEKQFKEIEELKDFITKLQATKDRLDSYDKENTLEIEKLNKEIEELKEKNEHITKEAVDFVNTHYISKDEINAKILECRKILYSFEKELELKANKEKYIHKESMNCLLSQISILQSLLEKE